MTPATSEELQSHVSHVHQGPYDNLMVHPQGLFHLLREGTQVTATFTSAGSAVQFSARQRPEVLFTIPLEFRPTEILVRTVAGWPVTEGVLDPDVLVPIRFRMQVAPNGEVRYLDGPELDEVAHLAYMLTTTWTSTDVVLGHYDNLEAHHEGSYVLQRTDHLVTARLHSTRSSVKLYARRQSAALFTVPAGYRPTHTMTLTITQPQPVDEAGQPLVQPSELRSFRVQVTPDGEVRYARDAPLDEADYWAYEVELAWHTDEPLKTIPAPPLPADAADLCTRHLVVQGAVLTALGRGSRPGPACATVTWDELSTLETLALRLGWGHAPLQRRDFAGLAAVTSLKLRAPDLLFPWWPADLMAELSALETLRLDLFPVNIPHRDHLLPALPLLNLKQDQYQFIPFVGFTTDLKGDRLAALLRHTPGLEQLTVMGRFQSLPDDVLAGVPALRQLTLKGEFQALPSGLLVATPQLRQLAIGGWQKRPYDFDLYEATSNRWSPLQDIPATLLDAVPRLEKLVLRSWGYNLSPTFLVATPQLQHLELYGDLSPEGSLPALLSHTPHLRHLTLSGWHLYSPPTSLLQSLPRLQSLHLRLGRYYQKAYDNSQLPVGLLAPVPQLQELILLWGSHREDGLPADLLTHVPRLRSLHVPFLPRVDSLQSVPQLEALQINSSILPDSLSYVPHLQSLSADLRNSPFDMANYVTHLSNLTSLNLLIDDEPDLPSFLAGMPNLTSLTLTSLTLDGNNLTALPADLLASTPELTSLALNLQYSDLETLPADLLAHTPRLTSLVINCRCQSIPPTLLVPVPGLLDLELHGWQQTPVTTLLVPGSFPPDLYWIGSQRGWLTLPEGVYPHAQTPFPYQGLYYISTDTPGFGRTNLEKEMDSWRDLLLRYPYLDLFFFNHSL